MDEIFISYSRTDSQFVDALIGEFDRRGLKVWIDRESIEGGAAWRAAISEAIRECRAFLLVLSPQLRQFEKCVSRAIRGRVS